MSRREDQSGYADRPTSSSSNLSSAELAAQDYNDRQRGFSRTTSRTESPRIVGTPRSGSSRDMNNYFDVSEPTPEQSRSPGSHSATHSPSIPRRGQLSSSSGSMYRRPSSSASQAGGNRRDSQSRRLSNESSIVSSFTSAAASPSSQPSTPRTKNNSSRSRILASSAAALDSSPPWQQQRLGSEGALMRSMSPLPIYQQPRMRNMSGSTIGTSSVAERKRRLASASGSQGGSAFDDGMSDAGSISAFSMRAHAETAYNGYVNGDQASIYSTRSSYNAGGPTAQRRRGQSSADEYQQSERTFAKNRTHSASNIEDDGFQDQKTDTPAAGNPVSTSIKDRFFSLYKDKRVKDDDDSASIISSNPPQTSFNRNFGRPVPSHVGNINNAQSHQEEMVSPRTPRKDLPASRKDPSKLAASMNAHHIPQSQSAPVVQSASLSAHDDERGGDRAMVEPDVTEFESAKGDSHHVQDGSGPTQAQVTRLGAAFAQDEHHQERPKPKHMKSSSSISSMASYASHISNGSVPARNSSLMQIRTPGVNAVAPPLGSPAASSYKSVPPSPVIASSMSHDEGFPRSGSSLAQHSSNRASWRLSTLSTAAGQSGAGALAAIRARFGEPATNGGTGSEAPIEGDELLSRPTLEQLDESDGKISEEAMEMMAGVDGSGEVVDTSQLSSTDALPVKDQKTTSPSRNTKMEPLRPVKSPLRGRNSLNADSKSASPMVPPKDDLISAPRPLIPKRSSPLSPPRKSLEEVGVGSALYVSESQSSNGSLVGMTPSSSQTSIQHQRSRTSNSSHSAHRGALLSHADESQASIVTDEGTHTGHGSSITSAENKSKRYNTLRRMTPPALFGSKASTKNATTAQPDTAANGEGRQRTPSAETTVSVVGQRKKSMWRLGLGKNDSQEAHGEDGKLPSPLPAIPGLPSNTISPKLGSLTNRSRKSDPVERPPIKKFFDSSPNIAKDLARNGGKEKGGLKESPSIASLDRHYRELVPSAHGGLPGVGESEAISDKSKALLKRRNAIRELIETEKAYAADLTVIRDVYLIRAKTLAGLPAASPLHTPLTSYGTPVMASPAAGTPSLAPSGHANFASKRGTNSPHTGAPSSRQQNTAESQLTGGQTASSGASIPSAASSGNPSNRSSTYTTSSHTSSEYSFHWPPNGNSLPGTPSVGAPSSLHKNANALGASPAPSTQQFRSPGGNLAKLQTGSVLSAPLPVNSDAPLSASDMRVIFAHLESCLALAMETSSVLQAAAGVTDVETGKADKHDDAIGQAFLMLMPRIEVVFTAYCSRHEASMQRLQELLATSPKAANFFRESTEVARKMTTAWDLASLLIKPVQRVLKYPLLLRQILSATSSKHRDHANLVEALHNMQNVADKINQVKRRRDLADYLITGRDREGRSVGQSGLNPSQTIKGKKRGGGLTPRTSNNGVGEETLISDEALEMAAEEYGEILKRFEALQSRVAIFGRQCGGWSHALRECYYVQLRIIGSLRHIYSLRLADVDAATPRQQAPSGPEDGVLAIYMDVLKTVINRSWRQMDSEIRSAILPMTLKIETMFDAPRSVIVKRDEREADYVRCRQMLAQGGANAKSLDRKMIESANGFVALQSQLIDELPAFVQGVQVLLDVGVQAFARLQAAHFDEVRNLTLEFWSDKAGHADEVDMVGIDDDDMLNVGPTLRHINPIRAFWESHRPFSQWGESLLISRRESELQALADDSEAISRGSAYPDESQQQHNGSIFGNVTPTASVAHDDLGIFRSPFVGHDDGLTAEERNSRIAIQNGLGLVHSGSNADGLNGNGGFTRRPSGGGVAGLIKSISGTFSRDPTPSPGIEVAPPLPEGATTTIRQHRAAVAEAESGISSVPPSLPSLVFRDDGSDGFFIVNSPVAFLDAALKEPYDRSPTLHALDSANSTGDRLASDVSLLSSMSSTDGEHSEHDSSYASAPGTVEGARREVPPPASSSLPSTDSSNSLGVPRVPSSAPQRHKIKALFQCVALRDSARARPSSSSSAAAENHLGWPFVRYACGDTFRVLSSDTSGAEHLLFGRLDKSGELGWVEKAHFTGGGGGG